MATCVAPRRVGRQLVWRENKANERAYGLSGGPNSGSVSVAPEGVARPYCQPLDAPVCAGHPAIPLVRCSDGGATVPLMSPRRGESERLLTTSPALVTLPTAAPERCSGPAPELSCAHLRTNSKVSARSVLANGTKTSYFLFPSTSRINGQGGH